MTSARGFIAWEGRSPRTGDQIALVVTLLSRNEKTGPMAQTWLLLRDTQPFEAVRTGKDEAICGGCARRGDGTGAGRTCYVSLFTGPLGIWRGMQAGNYSRLTLADAAAKLAGRSVRVTAYGDPAIIGVDVWRRLLRHASGRVGYTHQWRTCDPEYQSILMASCDSELDAVEAQAMGWRTFRVRSSADSRIRPNEIVCPASDEGGRRTVCARCELCSGNAVAAKNIVIVEHGRTPGNRAGKYNDVRAIIEAGGVAVHACSERHRMRVTLALRQFYLRKGDRRQVRSRRIDAERVEFWLQGES